MRNGFRRFLSSFIVVVMMISLLPAISYAAEGDTPYTDFSYSLSGSNIILGKYNGTSTTVVVPGSYVINNATYTTYIDSNVTFNGNTKITSVTLGSGVKFKNNTMDNLFANCSAITNIDLTKISTKGVTSMKAVFRGCSVLKSLNLSSFDTSSVTTMYNMFFEAKALVTLTGFENWNTSKVQNISYMFCDCPLTNTKVDLSKWNLSSVTNSYSVFFKCYNSDLILPSSLKVMGAFFVDHMEYYNKTYFTIPKAVEQIGSAHFMYNFGKDSTFKEFRVEEGNTHFKSVDGVLYSMDGTEFRAMPRGKTHTNNTYEILEGVTFIPELSFSRTQKISTLVLPDSYVIRQSVPKFDPEYILPQEMSYQGNPNVGNSLSIAIYLYTTIANYEVKETNKRYKSDRGIIYSKDMDKLLAVPLKYNKDIIIPEGVRRWEEDAMYYDGRGSATNSHTVKIPASMIYIGYYQHQMLNYLKSSKGWKIEVDENNPVYKVDANGYIVQKDITSVRTSLSASSYIYDGTAKTPAVTVSVLSGTTSLSTKTLTKGTDYTVEYINNVNAGKAQVKVTGIGSYSGVVYKDFYIEAATPYTDFDYTLDSTAKTVTLGKYKGTAKSVVVHGTYTVNGTLYTTVIDSYAALNNNTNITSVKLCSGVKFKDNKMDFLFANCSSLVNIDMSRVKTSDVTSLHATFYNCTSLKTLDVSNFDTSKVTSMYCAFYGSSNLVVTGYEKWDTRSLTRLASAFDGAKVAETIDLSAWNLTNVTDVKEAFENCKADTVILPNARTLLTVENQVSHVPNYEVSKANIYYSSDNGIIYSNDMTAVNTIPYKYNKDMVIPEGVKSWAANAFDTTKQAEATTSHKIIIPASMTYIDNSQLALINYLKGSKSWKIEVDKNNPVFKVDSNGYLVQKGISDLRVTLSETSFEYDGTEKKPTVTVTATTGTTTVSQKTLTLGTDYTVEYLDNINAGTGKVKITGKGSYSGIVYKPFTITSTTTPAKKFKYTKTNNDIAVELPTSLVKNIKNMEKIQIIVAYYDKETDAFLRMEKKTVRALTGDIIESFKLANEGEYAKVYVWNGDIPEVKPAYTYLTIE